MWRSKAFEDQSLIIKGGLEGIVSREAQCWMTGIIACLRLATYPTLVRTSQRTFRGRRILGSTVVRSIPASRLQLFANDAGTMGYRYRSVYLPIFEQLLHPMKR